MHTKMCRVGILAGLGAVLVGCVAGCQRHLVVTNASGRDFVYTRTVDGVEQEATMETGDQIVVPVGTRLNLNGMLVEVR